MPLWRLPFRATWNDGPFIKALLSVSGGSGNAKIAVARLWEYKALVKCGMTESEWAALSLAERARKIVATHYSDWLSVLAMEARK